MSNYEVPSWAGKPPAGTHLDVLKEEKLIQVNQEKVRKYEKNHYVFFL